MVILLVSLISCSDDTNDCIEQGNNITKDCANEISTRCGRQCDIEYLHNLQSDKMAMILDRIVFMDSTYLLNLSLEESRLIGIPDSIYGKGLSVVSFLNKKE